MLFFSYAQGKSFMAPVSASSGNTDGGGMSEALTRVYQAGEIIFQVEAKPIRLSYFIYLLNMLTLVVI